jgi:hypothetical protein
MCRFWRGYDVAGVGGGKFTLRLIPRQKVAPLYWRSDTHTHTHTHTHIHIISTPSLLQGLHTMSLLKSVPEGLKPQECKRTKLREPPPVPYVPTKKNEVQAEVTRLRNLDIKTTIEKDTTLNFPVWHENGTREAFLMHVTAVLE